MIKAQFTPKDVRDMVQKRVDAMLEQVFQRLVRIGLVFVKDARLKADFTDRTGNLRSSIGFVIMRDGKQVYGDFELSKKGTDRAKGESEAKQLAQLIATKYSDGFALIVVAGMEYAAAVESKGKDVITGSSLEATASLNKAFKRK